MTIFNEQDNEYMEESNFFNFQKGFNSIDSNFVDYGDYYYQMKKWYNGREYTDAYCRTLAFEIMQDFIHVSKPLDKSNWGISNEDDFLYGDYDSLINYKLTNIDESKFDKYFTIFNPVLEPKSNVPLGKQVEKQWSKYEVTFDDGKLSLITIWHLDCNDEKKLLKNVHAGVLFEDKDETLFIEKTNPLAPYQITKFNSVDEVKEYMQNSIIGFNKKLGINIEPCELAVLRNDKIL